MEPTDCMPAGSAWSQAAADEETRRRAAHYRGMADEAERMGGPTVAQLSAFVTQVREWIDGEDLACADSMPTSDSSWGDWWYNGWHAGMAAAYRAVAESLVTVLGVPE